MFAIQNQKTGKFVYGTDYRYFPRRQRTASNQLLTFDDYDSAENNFIVRGCGKDYRIVELKPVKVKRVLPPVVRERR